MTDKNQESLPADKTLQTENRSFCRAWLLHLTLEQQRRLLLLYKNSNAQNTSQQLGDEISRNQLINAATNNGQSLSL